MTQQKHHILYVEDEKDLAKPLVTRLERSSYTCHHVSTGEEALEYLKNNSNKVDLLLLDLNLGPGIGGFDVLHEMREKQQNHKPLVLIFSVTMSDDYLQLGAQLGSDGFVQKGCSHLALLNHIEMLKGRMGNDQNMLPLGGAPDFFMDEQLHDFILNSRPIMLTRHQYRITKALFNRPNTTFNQEQMYIALGLSTFIEEGTLARNIADIRGKIDSVSNPGKGLDIIQTHVGFGYSYPLS